MKFAAVIFPLLLPLLNVTAYPKEKPDIIRCDVQYLDMLVRFHVQWQSPNPITFVRAIVGKEQKEVKIDEYDNVRIQAGMAEKRRSSSIYLPGKLRKGFLT